MRPLLEVRNLKTHFFTRYGLGKAVDGVSFSVHEGETLGLVGESACGKSVTCLSIVRLLQQPPGRIVGGEILFEGEDLLKKSKQEMRRIRGKRIAMVLQDPMTSLDPVFSVGWQVGEAVRTHNRMDASDVRRRVRELLGLVKIPSPAVRMGEFPHQMSGGMRQRIVAAMALGCTPRLLIADEPTTSLDVTIQAQVLKLLQEIQKTSGLSMLMVTHDFGIVAKACDRVAVMYAGRIVESGDVRTVFQAPVHPYTVALMRSVPRLGRKVGRLFSIEGQPPDVRNLPPGCSFHPRCPQAMEVCRERYPPETDLGQGHAVRCWLSG